MKRFLFFVFSILVILSCGFLCISNPYYTPAIEQKGLIIQKHHDSIIRIAYIGDSWADGHKNKRCVIDTLIQKAIGKDVLLHTAGISGLTSKNIYYSIFKDDSVKSVIEWGPDFCFISVGINDSDRKMGRKYYKENMRLLIDYLLNNQIVPVILEIPTFDIKSSFKRRDRKIKLMYLISMLVTWSKMDCIEDYRKELLELIDEQHWEKQVVIVKHEDWNVDGYKDSRGLYDAGLMHLNQKGYLVLDTCIARKITSYITGSLYSECH